jgi:LmbE family N-acetylglucosaminyl deacetylase
VRSGHASAPRAVVLDTCPGEAAGTRAALRRKGLLVLGADDAHTALQLVPSADVLVADPRGDDQLLSAACAALSPDAVLVLYTDLADVPADCDARRSTVLVARGDLLGLLDTLAAAAHAHAR